MRLKTLTTLALFGAAAALHGQVIFMNFLSDDANGSYTGDGSTTWNQFYYDDNTDGSIDTIAAISLFDAANVNSGINFELLPAGDAGEFATSPSNAIFQNTPATGFNWFDPAIDAQRHTSALDGSGTVTYVFSGFSASAEVEFAFVIGREGSGTRRLTLVNNTTGETLLNNAPTNAADANYVFTTVTGFTSYAFVASTNDQDSPSALINAAAVVIPEPSAYAMLGGLAAFALVAFRRFRKRA